VHEKKNSVLAGFSTPTQPSRSIPTGCPRARGGTLIADLTHENRGAYWEAGYAEGLGKPVIYVCEKSKFETLTTHFDTNHHTTVLWDRNDLEKAASELKSTIRETLPEDAKLTDDG
jgi:nucleoside 2-deoxyribosyltransferase